MSFTIGRFTSTVEPRSVVVNGNQVTFVVDLAATVVGNDDQLRALRQQFIGLGDNEDEEVVPVTWSMDPTFDGFYRVVSSNSGDPQLLFLRAEHPGASVTLERLRGYASPAFEVTVQAVVRTNVHSITAPPTIALVRYSTAQDNMYLYSPAYLAASLLATPATTADSATILLNRYTLVAPLATTWYQHSIAPAGYYVGGCKIEIKYGSTWYPVIGRDIPKTYQGAWRITNGLVRFTTSALYNGTALFEVWGGVDWETVSIEHYDSTNTGIGFGGDTGSTPLTIIRNSPESVIVAHGSRSAFVEYFSVTRGERHVVWHATTTSGTVPTTWGVRFTGSTASSAITAGLASTSDDANGNRWLFASPQAVTTTLASGRIRLTSTVPAATFAFGAELNAATATTGDTAASIVSQFMGAVSTRQRVVVK